MSMQKPPTKTMSVRLPESDLETLKWDADLRGVQLAGELRAELSMRAERIRVERGIVVPADGPIRFDAAAAEGVPTPAGDDVPDIEDLEMPPARTEEPPA